MALTVYHKDNTPFFTIKKYDFSSEFMGEKKIDATVYSPDKITFEIDAYVLYKNEKYSIFKKTNGTKIARTGEGVGDAMQYDLEFFAPYKIMQRINFEDYVSKDDTQQYYTGTPVFYFFNNINELAVRLQANLDRFVGADVWSVTVADGLTLEEKQVSVSNINLLEGLKLTQSIYGLNFYISGTDIVLGGDGSEISTVFRYGKGNGLYEISRQFENGQEIITRLKSYGASRNLPQDYLRDENSKGRYFTNLMLPNFAYTQIDYVDAAASVIEEYGIREGSYTFEDVYPSIEEIDLGSGRIDEIISVASVDLDSDYFIVGVRDLGFNINDYILSGDTPRISIKGSNSDGNPTYLGGYEFEIVEVEWNGTGYTLTLLKNQADNIILPDNVTSVRTGDRFVILGIEMPQTYITNAENKLALRAAEYMQSEVGETLSYPVKVDEKFILEQELEDVLDSGKKAKIEDEDLDVANFFTIQNLSIKYGSVLPSYEMKLSNIKAKTLKAEFNQTKINQGIINADSKKTVNFNTSNNRVTVNEINTDITWA